MILKLSFGVLEVLIPLLTKIFLNMVSSSDDVYERMPVCVTILISHVHQDHIQGLNFFKPMNLASTKMSVFGFCGFDSDLSETLSEVVFGKSFPINLYDINADFSITDITETDIIILNDNDVPCVKRVYDEKDLKPKKDEVIISFLKSNAHPNFGVMCFKIAYGNKSIVYASDTEGFFGGSKRVELFARKTDLLIHDSQYTTEDYLSVVNPKQGFGHSTFDMAYEVAQAARVKRLAFFHFDPSYSDEKLLQIEKSFKNKNKNYFLAKEGLEVCL